MENLHLNNGMQYEVERIRKSFGAEKSDEKSYDYLTRGGSRVEVKFFTVKPAEDYTQKKAVYNSAHAHGWALNENGEIDYLASVEAFANECDILKVGIGTDWNNCVTYTFKSYRKRYAFYFCRLQWQDEDNGRLCVNPKSKTAGGRARQLETLKANGVVNVPTAEEIAQMFDEVFG